MTYKHIQVSTQDSVATLRLARPPLNVMTIEMMEEINDVLLSLRDRQDVKLLLIRGSREAFSAGVDVTEHTRDKVGRLVQVFHRIFETIRLIEVVSIAAVEGMAADGGFELALGCNMIVATDDAEFSLPEIKLGIFPPVAAVILPGALPRRKAMEWILSGATISASELAHYGLVNKVLPADRFEEGLAEFTGRFTAMSGPVLRLAKRAQMESYYVAFGEALYRTENMYLRELMALNDPQEGVRAFTEKREPNWTDS